MRRGHHVVEHQERVGLWHGLFGEHIQGRAGQLAVAERVDQGPLVDDASPRGVHDPSAVLHQGDLALPDQRLCLRGAREVDRDEVRLDQESLEVGHQLDAQRLGPFLRHVRVVGHEAHAEGLRPLGNHGTDPPQAHHAKRLAVQLDPQEPLPLPPARLDAGVRLGDVAGLGQEQGDGVLGGRQDVGLGRVDHRDAAAGGGVEVHVVQADPGPAHDAKVLGPLQHLTGDLGLGPADQRVVRADGPGQSVGRKFRPDVDREFLPQEVEARVGQRLGDQDLEGLGSAGVRHGGSRRPVTRRSAGRTRLRRRQRPILASPDSPWLRGSAPAPPGSG